MQRTALGRAAWAFALWAGMAAPALAAEATDVLDAIDGDNLFDAHFELNYRAHGKIAKITREDIRNRQTVEVDEFQYVEHSHQVIPRIRIGVFQDIELFAQFPYTVWEQRLGWFSLRNGNTTQDPNKKGYSTFLRDMCTYGPQADSKTATDAYGAGARPKQCGDSYPDQQRDTLSGNSTSWPVNHGYSPQQDQNGVYRPGGGGYTGRDTDWAINPDAKDYNPQFNSIRGAMSWNFNDGFSLFPKGLGDAELGVALSPYSIGRFNDARDSAMPSMRLELKYQLPTGAVETPGPGCQRMNGNTCINGQQDPKRREALGFVNDLRFDPGGVGSGLHRIHAGLAMSKRFKLFDPYFGLKYTLGIPNWYPNQAPERSLVDPAFWSHVAEMQLGVELAPLYAFPDLEKQVNLRIILGFVGDYIAKHRGPSEMSDALHKWTYVDHYLSLLGRAGLVFAVPFVTMRALVEGGHETPHFLTGEVPGVDPNGDGISKSEVNGHFNPLLDTPGRRVKVTETVVVNGQLSLAITF